MLPPLYLQGSPLCLQTARSFPLGGGRGRWCCLPSISRILPLSPICLDFSFYVFRLPLSAFSFPAAACSLYLRLLPFSPQDASSLSPGCSSSVFRLFARSPQVSLFPAVEPCYFSAHAQSPLEPVHAYISF